MSGASLKASLSVVKDAAVRSQFRCWGFGGGLPPRTGIREDRLRWPPQFAASCWRPASWDSPREQHPPPPQSSSTQSIGVLEITGDAAADDITTLQSASS